MKANRQLTLGFTAIIITVALSMWAAETATTNSPAKPAWEHLVFEREGNVVSADRELAEKINRLGGDGWEICTVTPVQQDGTTKRLQFYFKRPKV